MEFEGITTSTPENFMYSENVLISLGSGRELYNTYSPIFKLDYLCYRFEKFTDKKKPFSFKLGMGQVIQGWDLGM